MSPAAAERPKTLISYSRKDSVFALKLAEELRQAGANVWLDQLDIAPGMPWDTAIQEALNTCPRLLVILSPDSVASRHVLDEVSYALGKGKTVIPVLYRECEIPFRLDRLNRIDVRDGITDLLRVLGAPETADRTAARRVAWWKRPAGRMAIAAAAVLVVSAAVWVVPAWLVQPAEIVSFTATPLSVAEGGEVSLSWETRNARAVTLNSQAVQHAGEVKMRPAGSTVYRLVAADARGGQVANEVHVAVSPAVRPRENIPQDAEVRLDPRVEVERLAGRWMRAYLSGDADGWTSLSSEPFYFDQKIILSRAELKQMYLEMLKQKGDTWKEIEIARIRVETARELQGSGYDLNKDRIFGNLNLTLDDYAVTVRARMRGREEGMILMVRKGSGGYEVVGMWD
jgi:hypothetical protein